MDTIDEERINPFTGRSAPPGENSVVPEYVNGYEDIIGCCLFYSKIVSPQLNKIFTKVK